jgi:hypothetical protein
MTIIDCIQYDPSWWEARRGIPTASGFDRIITPTGKPSAQADGYIDELIGDLVDLRPNAFSERGRMGTPEMQAGRDAEPAARAWYALESGADVKQVGFCLSDCGRFGCSPDGLVGDDGVLELKCPMLKTQSSYLRKAELPNDYRPQVHGHLLVTGRKWVDFMSYAPGLPTFRVTVVPDEYTAKLKAALDEFLVRYAEALAKFNIKPRWQA